MISFPNAKINLGLNIISKREDGYHNIESIFYPVGCKDILEVIESTELLFQSSGIEIPGDSTQNLCLKAYNLLKKDFDIPPVTIHLHKVIPIGAGLGGGSSDAAFTLKVLNNLFQLNISNKKLETYARLLGSDCAFFIENKPVFAMEKGDVFEDINLTLDSFFIVLVNPNIHISTAEAYAGITVNNTFPSPIDIIKNPMPKWKGELKNDFELSIAKKYPEIESIKNKLYSLGALYSAMTGSGSTVFGIFDKLPELSFPKDYFVWHSNQNK